MKPEQLYQELKKAADKLGLHVEEHNFKPTGIHVKSGFCLVKDEPHCIINKYLKISKKTEILGECLCEMPHEAVFMIPAVREYLDSFTPKGLFGEKLQKDQREEGSDTAAQEGSADSHGN